MSARKLFSVAGQTIRRLSVAQTPAVALTIAGISDSGGGAGIRADLETFATLSVFGCSIITALTPQNTYEVQSTLDAKFVNQQMDAFFNFLYIKAVKVGMLSQSEVISTVAQALEKYKPPYVVVDPVMAGADGGILQKSVIETLKTELFPKASLITPNLHEAAALLNCDVPESEEQMKSMVKPLLGFGSNAVILKGGRLGTRAIDFYYDHDNKPELDCMESEWVKTDNTYGRRCTFSSAITAYLAHGYTMNDAVHKAKTYVSINQFFKSRMLERL